MAGFLENKVMLEAQYRRLCERPHGNQVDLKADAGPNRMLFLLDRLFASRSHREHLKRRRAR